MPEITGAVGGVESRRTVAVPVVVPPALVALQVTLVVAPSPGAVGAHPLIAVTGDCASLTVQLTVTGPRYQRLAPSGAAGETVAVTTGGVGSNATRSARSASRKPLPQSRSGTPGVTVQSSAFAGSVMIASSASMV